MTDRDAHPPQLLSNGTIHSTAEPYAEAMLVENGDVAWLGSDETADRMSHQPLHEQILRQDLDRALVTPGFVGAVELPLAEATTAATADVLDTAAHTRGYVALRMIISVSVRELRASAPDVQRRLNEVFTAASGHPVQVYPVVKLTGVAADGGAPSISPINDLLDLLPAVEQAAGRPAALSLKAGEVLQNLLGVRSWATEAGHQLLLEVGQADPDRVVDALVNTHKHLRELKQTPSADTPTVLVGFDSESRGHWEQLLNTGVHVLLTAPGHLGTALSVGVPTAAAAARGVDPWMLITQQVHSAAAPVSARAAFNAHTRGAYRSLPGASATAGQLNPGSEATYVVWEVESLTVQTPHSTVAAWSTDTRARTPLLPYLDGETLPRLVSTVIAGSKV